MKIICNLILLLLSANAYSNNSDSLVFIKKTELTDTTYECTIVTASRSVYKNINMFGYSDSTIKILKDEVSREIKIQDIKTIKFKGRGFMKGALIGLGIGFVLGGIIGGQGYGYSYNFNFGSALAGGIVLGIPFSLIGGTLGKLFAEDNFYDLSKLNYDVKKRKIKYLIKENSDR